MPGSNHSLLALLSQGLPALVAVHGCEGGGAGEKHVKTTTETE